MDFNEGKGNIFLAKILFNGSIFFAKNVQNEQSRRIMIRMGLLG